MRTNRPGAFEFSFGSRIWDKKYHKYPLRENFDGEEGCQCPEYCRAGYGDAKSNFRSVARERVV